MNRKKTDLRVMQEHIQTVEKHLDLIHFLLDELRSVLPFTAKIMEDMTMHQKVDCDALIFRFSLTQDTMATKVLPDYLELTEEQTQGMSFIDKLHLLERLEIIDDADQWRDLRELRNHYSHVYTTSSQDQADYLNKVCKAIPIFDECLERIKKRILQL